MLKNQRLIRRTLQWLMLFLALFVFASCVPKDPAHETGQGAGRQTVKAEYLNMRSQPSMQGTILTVLKKGQRVRVKAVSGKWVKVKTLKGLEGWVFSRYITGFDHLFQIQTASGKSKTEAAAQVEQKSTSLQDEEGKQQQESRDSSRTFSHPGGLFSIELPQGWVYVKLDRKDFETYVFKNQAQSLEFQVKATLADNYSDIAFYRDLASLLMERFGTKTRISDTSKKTDANKRTWLFGTVTVRDTRPVVYKHWICKNKGILFALVEISDSERRGREEFEKLRLSLKLNR